MAKINEEIIVIKVSTLLPDHAEITPILGDESMITLKQVIQEMAGDHRILVEIERAE
jgi:hypothetical protein